MLELILNEIDIHLQEFPPWQIVLGTLLFWQIGYFCLFQATTLLSMYYPL